MDVLRTKTQAEQARRYSAQRREFLQQFERQGKPFERRVVFEGGIDQALVRGDLEPLGHARGKIAARLDLVQVFCGDGALQQWVGEKIRGGNGILNSEIDAYASDW